MANYNRMVLVYGNGTNTMENRFWDRTLLAAWTAKHLAQQDKTIQTTAPQERPSL